MHKEHSTTRADRIIRAFKDHWFFAWVFVISVGIAGAGGVWLALPLPLQNAIISSFSRSHLDNGWIFLGYLNAKSPIYWSEGPYAQLIGTDLNEPFNPFPKGSRIVLNHDREIILIGYRTEGAKNAFTAPPARHSVLRSEDHTGSVLKLGSELIVRDVWVGHFPGSDYAVWARVVPATTSD